MPSASAPHIVVVGGGFGGLEAALGLRQRLGDAAPITLVADRDTFVFKPYLTYVPFGLTVEQIELDLPAIAETHGLRFLKARVDGLAPERRRLRAGTATIPYDYLVIATGAQPHPEEVPGLRGQAYSLWREADLQLLRAALDGLRRGAEESPSRLVFLAPPASQWTGPLYELALMTDTWLTWQDVRDEVEMVLITAEASYLGALGAHLHDPIEKELARRGIEAACGVRVTAVGPGMLRDATGEQRSFDVLITAPPYVAEAAWSILPTDARGFIQTEPATGLVDFETGNDDPVIYAVGDATAFPVKQALVALRQADAAAEHLAARLQQRPPTHAFDPASFFTMEALDEALLALTPPGEDAAPTLPVGQPRRLAINDYLPWRPDTSNPLYAGLLWKGTQAGISVLRQLLKS